ncbi:MAG TPA: heme-copper oxidase subunit III [Chthoniobacterales bacterium]|jgi:cytochrome c oxidase subunit 3/cytochrome o ubiquinol oxidase subunit 3
MDQFINQPVSFAEEERPWRPPSLRKVGMLCLITTETALFSIFVVAYLFYMGKSLNGPYPHEILAFPWSGSIALIGSSFTLHAAEWFLKKGNRAMFHLWWFITIAMGAYFLYFTGHEWYEFIYHHHLTISTNVFGSTFYSLVGLHASHVVVGLILLSIILISSLRGKLHHDHHEHVEMIGWYWHFVDAVWIVVLTVVYILSAHY